MVSSAMDVMRTGFEAYLDVLFPGEGIRLFEVEPPQSIRRRSSRLSTTRLSRRRSNTFNRQISTSSTNGVSPTSLETSSGTPSFAFQDAPLPRKLQPVAGDEEASPDDELFSSDREMSDATMSEVASSEATGVLTPHGSDDSLTTHGMSAVW